MNLSRKSVADFDSNLPQHFCPIILVKIRIFFLLFLIAPAVFSQSNSAEKPGLFRRYYNSLVNDTTKPGQPKFIIYPTLAYSPETSWEIGFSSLYIYNAKRDPANRLSEMNAFVFYTLENQYGLFLDHAFYTDKNRWFFLGKARYQSFPLLFYGIGSDSPSEYVARVDGSFVLIKERVLREIAPSFYAGAEVDFQSLFSVSFNPAEDGTVLQNPPRGSQGSSNLGLGLGLVYDSRHNVLNVRNGLFSELAFLRYDETWGSDFSFTSVISDNRIYRPVNERDVIAAQLFGQFTVAGNPPFNQLALMGGESLMRGYYLGRYRDRNLVASQVEYRMMPFPFAERFGAVGFLGAGQVFNDFQNMRLDEFLLAGGGGLRFLLFPERDTWLRLDVAFTAEGPGYYFFIGEAF